MTGYFSTLDFDLWALLVCVTVMTKFVTSYAEVNHG
jgi:hypothetical protein